MPAPDAQLSLFTTYLQRLGAFALAQVFHPATASFAAAQVLIPHGMLDALPPGAFRWASPAEASAAYHPVTEVMMALGRGAQYRLIYEAWEYDRLRMFRRLSANWPPLVRQALYAAHGIDPDEPLAGYAAAAAEAIAAARQALYSHP